MLDSTVAVRGTQNGDDNNHLRENTPFVFAGTWGGTFRTGGRLVDALNRNHNDLLISLAQGMGLQVTTFGQPNLCAGPLPMLA